MVAGPVRFTDWRAEARVCRSGAVKRLLGSRHVEDQRTHNFGASGIEILQAGEQVVDGVLLFL